MEVDYSSINMRWKPGLVAIAKHVKRADVAPSFGAASLDIAKSMSWMRLEESCYQQTIGDRRRARTRERSESRERDTLLGLPQ
jgi:hypothetical protein